uniref:Putative hemolymph juvenile hormone binding protein n=1 Tax=Lutzomyia longipalpis TaxID=7200 RepID=A0A1B0FV24_LUTLO
MKFLVIFAVVISLTIVQCQDVNEVQLPIEATVCKREDPKRNDCFKNVIQKIIPALKDGVPKLNITSIDPLPLLHAKFLYRASSTLLASLTVVRGFAYGFSESQIRRVRSQITDDEWKFNVDVTIPRLHMDGEYMGQGKFNELNLGSQGYFNLTLNRVQTTWKIRAKAEERDGETYMRVFKFEMIPNVKSVRTFIENLVPDPTLNLVVLELINRILEHSSQ